MKRLILISILFMIISSLSYAIKIDNISVAPKEGSYNIKMNADYYPDRDAVIGEGDGLKWGTGTTGTDVAVYHDTNIVSILEFVYSEFDTSSAIYYSIDVTTNTGEFEFVSQSDSAYSRPFSLYIVAKYRENVDSQGVTIGSYKLSSSFTERKQIPTEYTAGVIWFDMIIALPGEWIKQDEILSYDGKTYFLSEANDYASLFTITVTISDANGNIIATASSAHPCTGYLSKTSDLDDNFTMMISPTAASKNIDISKYGTTHKIADISLTYGVNRDAGENDTPNPIGNPVVFVSSSSNPSNSNADLFTFKHSDAGAFLTTRNSINYTITALSNNGDRVVFDGTDYMKSDGTVDNSLGVTAEMAYFESDYYRFILWWIQNDFTQSWYNYQGELYLTLDSRSDIMNEGRYESSVFVHIMDTN